MSDRSEKEFSKAERDVLDVLKDTDLPEPEDRPENVIDFKRRKRRARRPEIPVSRQATGGLKQFVTGRLTPAKLLAATVVFALGAVFLRSISGPVSMLLVVAAIAAFLGLFIVRSGPPGVGSSPSQPQVKRWRGRDIHLEPRRNQKESHSSWKRFLPGNRR